MVDRTTRAAHNAQGLTGVVAVEAGPGAVGFGPEAGGTAPPQHRRQLQAAVGEQPQHVGPRAPVPQSGQREQRLVRLGQRFPAGRRARLALRHDRHQVGGDPGDVGSRRDVGQGDPADPVGRAHAQRGQEARHGARMAVEHPPVLPEQLQAKTVAAGPGIITGR